MSSCAHVLEKTLNLVISRCCFAENGKEMYQNVKRTCRVLFWLINPIALWRSRCRRRPRCLSSLISSNYTSVSLAEPHTKKLGKPANPFSKRWLLPVQTNKQSNRVRWPNGRRLRTLPQGSYTFFDQKFKDFSRPFKDTFFHFLRLKRGKIKPI